MAKKKTKAEQLKEAVAEAVGAGRELHLETVDFSDPNRPKTCLEVDFPILPINHVAAIEGNAGKPIYQMSKWWARRRSSVFRSMLIAAATKAPDDPGEAAKLVWDSYYANHQKNEAFRKLKVADIFMGGGTTVVEGSRLGMQMYGNDLNPVAWLIVKNELTHVAPEAIEALLHHIEAEVKPQIMPFYACDCPRGHKGQWKHKSSGKIMDSSFDPLTLSPSQRMEYEYHGPEIIHVFWAKHAPCNATGCDHRTPLMSIPEVAVNTLTVNAWRDIQCSNCSKTFDLEQTDARLAPGVPLVIGPEEPPFSVIQQNGEYHCPHCDHVFSDEKAGLEGRSGRLGRSTSKKVDVTLFVQNAWMSGSPGTDNSGNPLGGSVTDSADATQRWNKIRALTLRLVEVRGKVAEAILCPDSGQMLSTDKRGGNIPTQSHFVCRQATCGREQDVLAAIKASGKSGPTAMYAIQGYCPTCAKERRPYSGKFFDLPSVERFDAAVREWEARRDSDLSDYWPRSEIPYGFMTHKNNGGIPNHGYTHWWTMFNARQLLAISQMLRAIVTAEEIRWDVKEFVLGAFQQFVRNENMFSFWHRARDHFAPHMSNNNYHPKTGMIELGVFAPVGYGPWASTLGNLYAAMEWQSSPWELMPKSLLNDLPTNIGEQITAKSVKVGPGDTVVSGQHIDCRSSSELGTLEDSSFDLVITDPPFGGLLHYSELADFFYVWLRLALKDRYPDTFSSEYVPKALEAVANRARHPEDADVFYQKILTECWREAKRILKPGGVLAFTFHHSEDEPWVSVLESLFDAGFYLEATYPIRSDETKGEGSKPGTIGSQKIEYDIIHVCRKRNDEELEPVSWARLRRQIMADVRQLQEVLAQHQKAGLQEADLQVIRRGKALEYYSRHYGKVYIEKGHEAEFTVKDALVGINQLLDDESDTTSDTPPMDAEPYTRQFLRLFADRTSLARDQMQKHLRSTGVSPGEFVERGWCTEVKKVFHIVPPLEFAQNWKGVSRRGMGRDFDQATFLVGACFENSGIRIHDTLNSPNFVPHPATGEILDWFTRHGGDSDIKNAAQLAKQLYASWQAKNKPVVDKQMQLFGIEGEDG